MKWLKRLGIILGLIYLAVCVFMYTVQEKMIFLGDPLEESYRVHEGEEVEIEVADKVSLNTWWSKKPGSKGVVVYFHGNVGNLRRCIRQTRELKIAGYDILMPDYRSYGKSDGYIYSEEQFMQDAQKVYDFAVKEYGEENVIIAGYSLGTGATTYLAANNKPSAIVLVAPYTSLRAMKNIFFWWVPDFLLKYHFDSIGNLKKVDCPILVFHGTNDELIPYESSLLLQEANPSKVNFYPLKNVGHRGAIFNETVGRKIREKLSK